MGTTKGRLITLEGGEGAGKSTQAERLASWLAAAGREVVRTREPGGTAGAEAIRGLLMTGTAERWLPSTELLLVAAARDDHLRRLVLPALDRGAWVICDRYLDSTIVYQGIAGGVEEERIGLLHRAVMAVPEPDLTIVLDLPVDEGLRRRRAAGRETRFEAKGRDFHELVRGGFLAIARQAPERVALVEATASPDTVAGTIRDVVAARFGLAP